MLKESRRDHPQIQTIARHLEPLPEVESPAFRTFRSLLDVDGSATNLVESVDESNVGRFDNDSSLTHALSPPEEW